jgi:alkylation response protein AidB-like acyl-CoA dehydrogenase
MSRETVIALRRFTEKLAYTPATMGAELAQSPSPIPPPELRENTRELGLPSFEIPAAPGAGDLPVIPRRVDATMPPPRRSDELSNPPTSAAANRAVNDLGGGAKATEQSLLQSLLGNIDMSTIGGMGIGGLGAYGLARMLQSEEEKKKNRFPWLSTLAGTAAGGFLVPALMNNAYAQQAGSAVANAASGAVNSAKSLMGGNA